MYPRGLPHWRQRFLCRTLNFGFLIDFVIKALRATFSSYRCANGMPRAAKSARA